MATYINGAFSAEVVYLDTELNGLANNGVATGVAINNSTDRDLLMKVQIKLESVDLSGQSGPSVVVRMIESIDGGTTFEDNDDKAYAITLPLAATNAAHTRAGDLVIPPGYFKLAAVNETGAAFTSTNNNVLSYVTYTPETGS